MRHVLISTVFLCLAAGCSGGKIGPHRIDVQQGNALDQENVARLKPGLNRSQVRFLLGTPLVVDPFHNDRWDYVYVYYKAGRLAEQKRVTLYFEGDALARIEGDLPAAEAVSPPPAPAMQPLPKAESVPLGAATAVRPVALTPPAAPAVPETAAATSPAARPVTPDPVGGPAVSLPAAEPAQAAQARSPRTSIVPPLASAKAAPSPGAPRRQDALSLQPETDVGQIRPEAAPSYPVPAVAAAAASDEPVLKALNAWAEAWARRDEEAYVAAYDSAFRPQDGGSRAEWEKRRRILLGVARNIEVRIDSPSVDHAGDGTVTVTFNQHYRSDSYRDAVVKQLRMRERDGRWLIVEEKVLSLLHAAKP
jgi:outer membrane protein assembly factor BamE